MALRDKVVVDIQTDTKASKRSLAGYAAAIGVAVGAVVGLTKVVKDVVHAYSIQEDAEIKLRATLKATRHQAGMTEGGLKDLAKSLQATTTFGDEATIAAESLMLTFTKISKQTFPGAIKAAQDMSVMFGQDLQSSVVQLGTALNDPIQGISRLRRIGISFTDEQKKLIQGFVEQGDTVSAQKIILKELHDEFGGVSEAMAQTASGSMKQLNNAVGDLKESWGELIAQSFKPTIRHLTEIATKTKTVLDNMKLLSNLKSLKTFDKMIQDIRATKDALDAVNQAIKDTEAIDVNKSQFPAVAKKKQEDDLLVLMRKKTLLQIALNGYEAIEEATTRETVDNEKKAADLKAWLLKLSKEYSKTLSGQLDAIHDSEKYWEGQLETSKYHKEQIAAILNMYYDMDAALETRIGLELKSNGVNADIEKLYGRQLVRARDISDEMQDQLLVDTDIADAIGDQVDGYKKVESAVKKVAWYEDQRITTAIRAEQQFFTVVQKGYANLQTALDNIHTQEIANIQQTYETQKKAIEDSTTDEKTKRDRISALDDAYNTSRAQAEKDYQDTKKKIARQALAWQKAAAVTEATINGIVAVSKALAELGPIAGPIAAGVLAALTAAQIAAIIAEPVPMAKGGVVTRPTTILAGEAGPEAIVPLNKAGFGNVTVHVHGSLITERQLSSYIYRAVEAKASGY